MARSVSPWTALLAGLVLACGSSRFTPPEPPRPATMADFDPEVALRVREALSKVESDPGKARSWADLGFVYSSERMKDLGLECFRVAERLDPKQPRWPYRAAILLAQQGALPEAVEAMQRSIALEPGYPPSHARLGDYRLNLGELDAAERSFRESTRLDSAYPGGWVGLARLALQRDQAPQAIEILERLLRDEPDDPVFRQLLGFARRQEGQGDGPVETLDGEGLPVWNDPWELEARSFQRKPDMLKVGRLLRDGKATEALRILEDERERGGNPLDTALSVATAQRQLGHPDVALHEIEALLAQDPQNSQALLMKVDLLDDGGDTPGAVALLESVTDLQPTFGGAFAALGFKRAQLGRHEEAVSAYRRALELGESDPQIRRGLAASLIALKQWSEARPLLETYVEQEPDEGDPWLQLAITRMHTGSLDEADEAFARGKAAGNASPKLLENVRRSLAGARERRRNKDAGAGSGDDSE